MEVVTPTLDGPVLYVLAACDGPVNLTQVHRSIGEYSREGIRRALGRLVSQGVVTCMSEGVARFYRLNREHLAAKGILELAAIPARFVESLQGELSSWTRPLEFVGVAPSGTPGRSQSSAPIDVLIVNADQGEVSVPAEDMERLRARIKAWTGNPPRLTIVNQRWRSDPDLRARVQTILGRATPIIGVLANTGEYPCSTHRNSGRRQPIGG